MIIKSSENKIPVSSMLVNRLKIRAPLRLFRGDYKEIVMRVYTLSSLVYLHILFVVQRLAIVNFACRSSSVTVNVAFGRLSALINHS